MVWILKALVPVDIVLLSMFISIRFVRYLTRDWVLSPVSAVILLIVALIMVIILEVIVYCGNIF